MSEWVYRLQCVVPEESREAVECFLWENVSWGWEETPGENGGVAIYCTEYEQARSLAESLCLAVPDVRTSVHRQESREWHEVWRDFFQPVAVAGTFLILPSWQDPPGGNNELIPLFIYPEMAFGTGHHPTTRLCLEAIAELRSEGGLLPGHHCLDLGTGSGVLGIACAACGAWALGVDNDRIALHNARTNRDLNGETDRFALAVGDVECLSPKMTFELVLANILAEPLLEMAPSLVRTLAPGGCLVLSGLLHRQEEEVSRAYTLEGLRGPRVLRDEEWSALVWRRE